MGLESGFILCSKEYPAVEIYFYNVCSYRTFDDWMRRNCPRINDSECYEVSIHTLKELKHIIERQAQYLHTLSPNQIWFYDEQGYPELVQRAFYGEEFLPEYRLMILYDKICAMLDILDLNDDDCYFEFYSSY